MGSSRPAEKGGRLGRPEACCKPPSWRRRGARTPHRPAGPRRRSPHHGSRAPRFSGSRCSSSPEARHVQDPWGASGDPPATGSPGSPPPWGPVPLTAPAPTPRKQGHLQQEPGQAHAHPEVHTASRSWHQALPQHAWPSPRLLGPESVLLRGGLHGTRSGLPGPQSQPPCVRPTLSTRGWRGLLGVGPQQPAPSRLPPAQPGPTPSGCPGSPTSHLSPRVRASQRGAAASPGAGLGPHAAGRRRGQWRLPQVQEGTGRPCPGIRRAGCNSPRACPHPGLPQVGPGLAEGSP